MHGNKTKFEWNVLVQSTRVLSHDLHGKTKRLKRFIDPLNHDSWSFSVKKKESTNKVDKQEIKEKRGELKPLLLGILCITGCPVHVAQKCIWRDELTILSLHVLLALHMDTSIPGLGGGETAPRSNPYPFIYLPTFSEILEWDFYPGSAGIFEDDVIISEDSRRSPTSSEEVQSLPNTSEVLGRL